MPSRATRSTQEAARRRQDNEAIAAAMAVDTSPTQVALPSVVSPPSAPNLTSLLTGHVGQEVGNQALSDMDINTQDVEQVKDSAKSPKKRNQKK
jgi:hypothetical protein